MKNVIKIVLIAFTSNLGFAQESSVTEVDSMMDQMQSKDQGAVTTPEKASAPKKQKVQSGKKTTKYSYNKETISGNLSETSDLQKLATAITKLEGDIDSLSSDLQKTNEQLIERSGFDNMIKLEVDFSKSETISPRFLTAKLDGFNIYQVDEIPIWGSNQKVPLFNGPLKPGIHRLDLDAGFSMRYKDRLPLESGVYHNIKNSFEINVPSGKLVSQYTVEVIPPNAPGEKPSIKLQKQEEPKK